MYVRRHGVRSPRTVWLGVIAAAAISAAGVAGTATSAQADTTTTSNVTPGGGSFSGYTVTSGGCLLNLLCSISATQEGSPGAYYLQTTYQSLLNLSLLNDDGTVTITSPSWTWANGTDPASADLTLQLETSLGTLVGVNNGTNSLDVSLIDESNATNDQDNLIDIGLTSNTTGFETLMANVNPAQLVNGDNYEIQATESLDSLISAANTATVDLADVGLNVTTDSSNNGNNGSDGANGSNGSNGSGGSNGTNGSSGSSGSGSTSGSGSVSSSAGGSVFLASGSCRAVYIKAPAALRRAAIVPAAAEVTAGKALTLKLRSATVKNDVVSFGLKGRAMAAASGNSLKVGLATIGKKASVALRVSVRAKKGKAKAKTYMVSTSETPCGTYLSAARKGSNRVQFAVHSTTALKSESVSIPKSFGSVSGITATTNFASASSRKVAGVTGRLKVSYAKKSVISKVRMTRKGNTVTVTGLPAGTHIVTLSLKAKTRAAGAVTAKVLNRGSSRASSVKLTLRKAAKTAAS